MIVRHHRSRDRRMRAYCLGPPGPVRRVDPELTPHAPKALCTHSLTNPRADAPMCSRFPVIQPVRRSQGHPSRHASSATASRCHDRGCHSPPRETRTRASAWPRTVAPRVPMRRAAGGRVQLVPPARRLGCQPRIIEQPHTPSDFNLSPTEGIVELDSISAATAAVCGILRGAIQPMASRRGVPRPALGTLDVVPRSNRREIVRGGHRVCAISACDALIARVSSYDGGRIWSQRVYCLARSDQARRFVEGARRTPPSDVGDRCATLTQDAGGAP